MRNVAPRIAPAGEDNASAALPAPPDEIDDLDWDDGQEESEYLYDAHDADESRSPWSLARRVALALSILIAACFAVAPSIYFFFLREPETELVQVGPAERVVTGPTQPIAVRPGSLEPAEAAGPSSVVAVRTAAPAAPAALSDYQPSSSQPQTGGKQPDAARSAPSAPSIGAAATEKVMAGRVASEPSRAVASPPGRPSRPEVSQAAPVVSTLPATRSGTIGPVSGAPPQGSTRADLIASATTADPVMARSPGRLPSAAPAQPAAAAQNRSVLAPMTVPLTAPDPIRALTSARSHVTAIGTLAPATVAQASPSLPIATRLSSPADTIGISARAVAEAATSPAVELGRSQAALSALPGTQSPALAAAQAMPPAPRKAGGLMQTAPVAAPASHSRGQQLVPAAGLVPLTPRLADASVIADTPNQALLTRRIVVASLQPLDSLFSLFSSPIGGALEPSAPRRLTPTLANPAWPEVPHGVIPSAAGTQMLVASLPAQDEPVAPWRPAEVLTAIPETEGTGAVEPGSAEPVTAPTPKPRPEYRAAHAEPAERARSKAPQPTAKEQARSRPARADSKQTRPAKASQPAASKERRAATSQEGRKAKSAAPGKKAGPARAAKPKEASRPKPSAKQPARAAPRQKASPRERRATARQQAEPTQNPARAAAPKPSLPAALLPTLPPR